MCGVERRSEEPSRSVTHAHSVPRLPATRSGHHAKPRPTFPPPASPPAHHHAHSLTTTHHGLTRTAGTSLPPIDSSGLLTNPRPTSPASSPPS